MNTFNVSLNIEDVCCCRCYRSRNERNTTLTNSSISIPLQNCFYLKIAYVTSGKALVILKRDYFYIIRYVSLNIPTNICLPTCDNCTTHYITIIATSIAAS